MASSIRTAYTILVCLLAGGTLSSGAPETFKCVSWNVNGVEKLRASRNDLQFLASFDVIFLQETYSGTAEAVLDIDGFIPHHQLGRPTPRRPNHHQWGVSTLMKIEAFVGGVIRRIPSPVDWLVVSRWCQSSDVGIVMVNIYLPVHSDGFTSTDSQAALSFIETLRSDFPADAILLGGDFNVDRWRVDEYRSNGVTIPTSTRLVDLQSRFIFLGRTSCLNSDSLHSRCL